MCDRTPGRTPVSNVSSTKPASPAPVSVVRFRAAPRSRAARGQVAVGHRDRRQVVEGEGQPGRVAGGVEVADRVLDVARAPRRRRRSGAAPVPSMCSDHASIVRSPTARNISSACAELVRPVARDLTEVVVVAEPPQDVGLAAPVADPAEDVAGLLE